MKRVFLLLLVCVAVIGQTHSQVAVLSPLDFGLREAKTDIDRFYVLKRCHDYAITTGAAVDYHGIDSIRLEIPMDAQNIPLSYYTDFAGVKMIVNNANKNFWFFKMFQESTPVEITGSEIDKGDFRDNSSLKTGNKMLIIEDSIPWITERIGYEGTALCKRKDILLLRKGRALNHTIQPYNNHYSAPQASFIDVDGKKKIVKNLNFVRTSTSDYITYLMYVANQCDVVLSNICITTPEGSNLTNDSGIILENCGNVELNDIHINKTYSEINSTGYGVRLLNVYNTTINRMVANGNWGVFNDRNVNKATLIDCNVNRFDCHYYGRDFTFENCVCEDMYNQYASVYGTIKYKNCIFKNYRSVLLESSFNAFTPFDVIWENCDFYLTKERNFFLTLFGVPQKINSRPELSKKSIPNMTVKNCRVFCDEDVKEWYLVQTGKVYYEGSFDYISKIKIDGLEVNATDDTYFNYFSTSLKTENNIKYKVKRTKGLKWETN